MNKQIVLLTIFILLLSSCAPNATPNVTVTSTFTPAPTSTPTITPTPTETPDPNKPVDATGKDAQGNYIKVENSVTYTWETNVPVSDNGETMRGWFKSMLVASAIDQPGDNLKPIITIDIRAKNGINIPTLTHTEFTGSTDDTNYSRIVFSDLVERVYGKSLLFIPPADVTKFFYALYGIDPATNGTVSLPITLANGQTVDLPLNKNTNFIIRVVDQADIPNPDLKTDTLISVTTVDVQTETVTITVAPTGDLIKYTDQDWAELLLLPLDRIIIQPDLSQKRWDTYQGEVAAVQDLDNLAIADPGALFKISWPTPSSP
jgi:hypothetical protein